MRKIIAVAALLVATLVPSAASAQFFVGARLGYGMPWGEVWDTNDLKDGVKSQIPIQLDLGLKLGQALALGVYGSYGFVQLSDDRQDSCDLSNFDCSASTLRVGAQANLHAANSGNTEFWGGVTLGYTRLTYSIESNDTAFTGFEGGLQGGFDFLPTPNFRVGPFASLTVGRFTKWDDGTNDGDIDTFADTTFHGWFQIGIRGMFGT